MSWFGEKTYASIQTLKSLLKNNGWTIEEDPYNTDVTKEFKASATKGYRYDVTKFKLEVKYDEADDKCNLSLTIEDYDVDNRFKLKYEQKQAILPNIITAAEIIDKDIIAAKIENAKQSINTNNQEVKYCQYCGSPLPIDAIFCCKCGKKL